MSGRLKNDQTPVNPSKTAAIIADSSPYLDGLLKIYGDISREDPLLTQQEDPTDIMPRLRILKQKVALFTALRDLNKDWALSDVTEYLSGFADFAVEQACESICQEFIKNKHFPAGTTTQQSGIAVIALGKWGAGELNYSSDIDFMVIFDPEAMPLTDRYDAQKLAVRFTQRLVEILEKNTADGYVFRTDLRLRPDPGATQIAVSLKACEIYYGSLGQNWERAAMIKARPVTGDPAVSKSFMTLMSQWIWRRSLDFATIQDIVSIKNQMSAINNRTIPINADTESLCDLDLKRDCGGIREIELFVQIQQLVYGGRQPALRQIRTCSALTALAAADHISPDLAKELTAAYEFLRIVEHRLQMRNDRQTHSLPKTPDGFDALARFCGFEQTSDFISRLQNHRHNVSEAFTSLFAETGSLTANDGARLVFTGNDIDAATVTTLSNLGFKNPRHIAERIRHWHHGHYRATRSTRARQILTHLVPQILQAFGKTQDPDTGFARFDRFLEQQTSGVSLFALFEHNPEVLDILAL
ncbi:MAG: bifunctional [glutamine synthetase] adenylyltransferase/[glutamine synthetase]-adenylyl-L-tyrosine phosphorylase, partial [Pseudomonadota bacterium]